ncbi:MAG TPA: AsmA-like C-terminal region-containing protein [Candidatus Sulfotelmatobacter sp.]|nr:AsmA-like C-terminal region-containing protein [Candidatus Sulfotelmatobacter sp.]
MPGTVHTSGKSSSTPAALLLSHRALVIAASIILLAIIAFLVILHSPLWPFERAKIVKQLSEASDSQVTVRDFRQTYFPPGCILDTVEFHHDNIKSPLITMQQLIVKGSYLGMLRHHLDRVTAVGMHVLIPPIGTGVTFHTVNTHMIIDEFIADGSTLEIAEREKHLHPFLFTIHKAAVRQVASGRPMQVKLQLHMPEPPAEVQASGEFGPWQTSGETPISGEYTLRNADLGHYDGIGGMLFSNGKFRGTLKHLNISGTTDVPDFVVKSGGHKIHLLANFDAYEDARRGDTFLKRVDAHFGGTELIVNGSIAAVSGRPGKLTKLALDAPQGRIQDVLRLFVTHRPPMSGETAMQADIEIPPGKDPFLRRVKLRGTFGVEEGKFAKNRTQTDVDKLSAGARGKKKDDAPNVLTDLSGNVSLDEGTATFTDLRFAVPGVKARLHGTYNIINDRIDLHGPMRVDKKIADTTSGLKSFLLKLIDPIFKKKRKGEVVPIHIGGTYNHPQFGLDLDEKNTPHAVSRNQPPSRQRK